MGLDGEISDDLEYRISFRVWALLLVDVVEAVGSVLGELGDGDLERCLIGSVYGDGGGEVNTNEVAGKCSDE